MPTETVEVSKATRAIEDLEDRLARARAIANECIARINRLLQAKKGENP